MKHSKDSLTKEYNEKVKLVIKHNKLYYEKDSPKISDAEYDNLKKDLTNLENKHNFLKKKGSIDNIVGSPPSNKFQKIKHKKPMLSLSNAFGKDDMNDFLKKIKNFIKFQGTFIDLFSEP